MLATALVAPSRTPALADDAGLRETIVAADLIPNPKPTAVADFRFMDIATEQFAGFRARFAGQVVLLNIWATWCKPCVREMPSLQSLHARFSDRGFTVVGINDQTRERQRKFVSAYAITFPCLVADVDGLPFRWRSSVPETYLFDRRGRLLGYRAGSQDWMGRRVQELVQRLTADGI